MTEEKLLMNGVEVKLKNPGTDGLKDFLILANAIDKIPKQDVKGKTKEEVETILAESNINFLSYLDDKAMDSAVRLIKLTAKKTFGELTEELDAWTMSNFMQILGEILQMCSPKQQTDDQDRIEKLKERLKQ